jgi:hypothetical protein
MAGMHDAIADVIDIRRLPAKQLKQFLDAFVDKRTKGLPQLGHSRVLCSAWVVGFVNSSHYGQSLQSWLEERCKVYLKGLESLDSLTTGQVPIPEDLLRQTAQELRVILEEFAAKYEPST